MSFRNCRSALTGSFPMPPETPVRDNESWDSRFLTAGLPYAEMPPPRRPGGRAGSTACASDEAVDPVIGRS
jgi:hypothetical protein